MTAVVHALRPRRRDVPRGPLPDRLVTSVFSLLTSLLLRLPDRKLHRAADIAGAGLYLAWPRRRALVRSNLRRVCTWLVAEGMASPGVARAAGDPRALDRLVRRAFGHYLRSYLEVALASGFTPGHLADRLRMETTASAEEAVSHAQSGRGLLFVALHMGSLELPALYAVTRAGRPVTAPMETLENRPLQAYLERSRSASGIRIVPARGSGRLLAQALELGGVVAVVSDRPITSAGRRVLLFGAPARLPTGPALLALESGAATYVGAFRRTGYGSYAARILKLELPVDGPRRERVGVFMARQARLFESIIADAPEQWWTVFFPIWDGGPGSAREDGPHDTAPAAATADAAPGPSEDAAGAMEVVAR